jgi:hypothetical protein
MEVVLAASWTIPAFIILPGKLLYIKYLDNYFLDETTLVISLNGYIDN